MNCSSLLLVFVAATMVGCAHDAGVISIGNGTFMISKSEWGIEHTGATVKGDALKEAGAFCTKQQRDLEVVDTSQQDMMPFKSEAQAEVKFRCH